MTVHSVEHVGVFICSSCLVCNFWKPWPTNIIYADTSSEYLCQVHVSGSSVPGQGHRSVKKYTFVGGLPSTERQSCLWITVNLVTVKLTQNEQN